MAKAAGDEKFLKYVHLIIEGGTHIIHGVEVHVPPMFETAPDQAVFWSNDYRDDKKTGKSYRRNEQLANARSEVNREPWQREGHQAVIKKEAIIIDRMEMEGKGYKFDGMDVSIGAKQEATELMSRAFAHQAQGTVTIFANYTGATSNFRKTELPELMNNQNVTRVRYVDTNDKEHTVTKKEWYGWQRQQWVDSRIDKLNETAAAWEKQTVDWEAKGQQGQASQPNSYAVNDFTNEIVHTYKNMSTSDRGTAPGYITPNLERSYAANMNQALGNITNETLHSKIVNEIAKNLASDPSALDMFNADLATNAALKEISLPQISYMPEAMPPVIPRAKKQPSGPTC